MDNGHLPDDKLFRAVQDRLSDYEAPYNGADWDAMSRSLDKLPKTSRFQWRISLNSLIVGVAIAGLTVLGYTLVAGNSSAATAPQAINDVKSDPGTRTVKTTLPATTTPTQSAVTASPQATTETVATPENTAADVAAMNQPEAKKQRKNAKHLFGDQIDPRKGFIYQTQEARDIMDKAPVDKSPGIYYDMDGGKVKKIVIDSTSHTGEKKDVPEQQQPAEPGNPGAPVNGGGDFNFGGGDDGN